MASLCGFCFNENRALIGLWQRTHMCGMCHMSQSQQNDMRLSASENGEKYNYLFRINGF